LAEDSKKETDSIAKACLPCSDLLGGKIVHVSFDCPENLREAFNQATKANGTSTCFVLRSFMQTFVVSAHYGEACFPNTKKPIVVENLVLPTFVKNRVRRYKTTEYIDEEKTVRVCTVAGCKNEAVAKALWLPRNEKHEVCLEHLAEAISNPRQWRAFV
jgi:hypothetical protein